MSSPKAKTTKPVKAPAAKPARGEMSGEDKAHFLKAMWEGVPAKEKSKAPENGASPKVNGAPTKASAAPAKKVRAAAPKVEILRKISAPVAAPTRSTPESTEALKLAALIEQKLGADDLDAFTPEAVQALLAAVCKYYGANMEAGNKFPALSGRTAVTGTDVMIVCGALLKAVDLAVFELGMWQTWSHI